MQLLPNILKDHGSFCNFSAGFGFRISLWELKLGNLSAFCNVKLT